MFRSVSVSIYLASSANIFCRSCGEIQCQDVSHVLFRYFPSCADVVARMIACPAARNFPCDTATESTIGALRAWAPAKRSDTLLLTWSAFQSFDAKEIAAVEVAAGSVQHAALQALIQHSNAVLAPGKIDIGELHEEARIGSTS